VAESYDNVGLIVGIPATPLTGVLVNLDVTEELIDEALERGCNLIVTHHPIWFSARKRLNGEDYVSRIIMRAIRQEVGLYACHTNLDNVREGVNRKMASRLGLRDLQWLRPGNSRPGLPDIGAGMVGTLAEPMEKRDFLQLVKESFGCGGIRYADCDRELVYKVAICGGSGSFLIGDAMKAGADAFVTADITYHKFFDSEGQMLLLDIGHHESEQFTSELICAYLSGKFPNFAPHLSGIHTNPVRYYA
jgi:dinuclear metal center YbgI/SA1388 family protein